MKSAALGTLVVLAFLTVNILAAPDRVDFALHPGDSEVMLFPGEQAGVTLYIESASAEPSLELLAIPVDWRVESDGHVRYFAAGTGVQSASAWLRANPEAIVIKPSGVERIRVTVKVPRNADPGIYRAGVFIRPTHEPRFTPRSEDVFRLIVRVMAPVSTPKWTALP